MQLCYRVSQLYTVTTSCCSARCRGPPGGAITAACSSRRSPGTPWVHVDAAGLARSVLELLRGLLLDERSESRGVGTRRLCRRVGAQPGGTSTPDCASAIQRKAVFGIAATSAWPAGTSTAALE